MPGSALVPNYAYYMSDEPDYRIDMTMAMYVSSSRLYDISHFKEDGDWRSEEWPHRPQGRALLGRLAPGDIIVTLDWENIFVGRNARQLFIDLLKRGVGLHIIMCDGDIFRNSIEYYSGRFEGVR
jgi:hypothetical protein